MNFALPFPNIDPVLIEIGMIGSFPLAIRWYGLLWMAGCVGAWWWVLKYFERSPVKVEKKHIDDFLVWAVIATVLGGRLGYGAFYSGDNFNFFHIWKGGLSFHGGLIGVIISVIVFVKIRKIPFWRFSDGIACAAPIGLFTVRIANFINGELYGRVTGAPWGMVFPAGGPEPRHPSQLYEAFLEGAMLFAFLYILSRNEKIRARPGMLTGIFMLGYGSARGLVEFVRQPDVHLGVLAFGLTMGQWLSIPVLLFGLYLVFRPHKTNP